MRVKVPTMDQVLGKIIKYNKFRPWNGSENRKNVW
jgi:hypothetical protein